MFLLANISIASEVYQILNSEFENNLYRLYVAVIL
jgi:hypothetical protein